MCKGYLSLLRISASMSVSLFTVKVIARGVGLNRSKEPDEATFVASSASKKLAKRKSFIVRLAIASVESRTWVDRGLIVG
ncbi:hypothetical protein B0T10DRAFT_481567 [Thelonectria olida]|uniref:Uncharacterized protein n=1 Tax=Thelonectria olida TaxID=1576542 RepID=A0A9P8W989_9HYPO|nr:hypothetical protein B0T10DRAFT_481567 [Thelonectria olida]